VSPLLSSSPPQQSRRDLTPQAAPLSIALSLTLVAALFLVIHFAAMFSPSLLDDADATHANAARHMAESNDFVTLKVDGIRYLEKPPLPYWLVSTDYRVLGYNVFATHLPMELSVLLCALLAWRWSRRAYGERAGLYAAFGSLTAVGIFSSRVSTFLKRSLRFSSPARFKYGILKMVQKLV